MWPGSEDWTYSGVGHDLFQCCPARNQMDQSTTSDSLFSDRPSPATAVEGIPIPFQRRPPSIKAPNSFPESYPPCSSQAHSVPPGDFSLRELRTVAISDKSCKTMESSALLVSNPGSIGHPEMCSMPCLFYVAGRCSSGEACRFCHASHPGRVVHLDKRNRDKFNKLNYIDRFLLMVPILRSKFEQVSNSEALLVELNALHAVISQEDDAASASTNSFRLKPERRQLAKALTFLPARALLSMLLKDGEEEPAVQQFVFLCMAFRLGAMSTPWESL